MFRRLVRQFKMEFELDFVRLENVNQKYRTRLEQLECSMRYHFDHANKLTSFSEHEAQFRNLSSGEYAKLSDNNRAICCRTLSRLSNTNDPYLVELCVQGCRYSLRVSIGRLCF